MLTILIVWLALTLGILAFVLVTAILAMSPVLLVVIGLILVDVMTLKLLFKKRR